MKVERRPPERRSQHSAPGIVACGSARAEGAEHSTPTADAARASARLAVEFDHVRLQAYLAHALTAERMAALTLAAAVQLAVRVEVCEALLLGVPVPAARLEPRLVRALRLSGEVELDEALVLRVMAYGPLSKERKAAA